MKSRIVDIQEELSSFGKPNKVDGSEHTHSSGIIYAIFVQN